MREDSKKQEKHQHASVSGQSKASEELDQLTVASTRVSIDISETGIPIVPREVWTHVRKLLVDEDIAGFREILEDRPEILHSRIYTDNDLLPVCKALVVIPERLEARVAFIETLYDIRFSSIDSELDRAIEASVEGHDSEELVQAWYPVLENVDFHKYNSLVHSLIASDSVSVEFLAKCIDRFSLQEATLLDRQGEGPVEMAMRSHEFEKLEFLLEAGFSVPESFFSRRESWEYFLADYSRVTDLLQRFEVPASHPEASLEVRDIVTTYRGGVTPDWLFLHNYSAMEEKVQELGARLHALLIDVKKEEVAHGSAIIKHLLQGKVVEGSDAFPDYRGFSELFKKVSTGELSELELMKSATLDVEASKALVRNMLLRVQLDNDHRELDTPSLSNSLEAERQRQSLRLKELSRQVQQRGFSLFDAEELFNNHGLGASRVLKTNPLIQPDYWSVEGLKAPGVSQYKCPAMFLNGATDRSIEGFSFRFGFYEAPSREQVAVHEPQGRELHPLVCLDPEVLSDLEMILAEDPAFQNGKTVQTPAQESHNVLSVLKGIRDITSCGGHDFMHHLVYGLHFSGDQRVGFNTKNSVFQQAELRGSFEKLFHFNAEATGMPSIEVFSYLSNREIWQGLFEEKPHLKKGLQRRFVSYVESVATLKRDLEPRVGHARASRIGAYLTSIGFAQMGLIMSFSDLEESRVETRSGKTLSQVIDDLDAPYQPDPGTVCQLYKRYITEEMLCQVLYKNGFSYDRLKDFAAEASETWVDSITNEKLHPLSDSQRELATRICCSLFKMNVEIDTPGVLQSALFGLGSLIEDQDDTVKRVSFDFDGSQAERRAQFEQILDESGITKKMLSEEASFVKTLADNALAITTPHNFTNALIQEFIRDVESSVSLVKALVQQRERVPVGIRYGLDALAASEIDNREIKPLTGIAAFTKGRVAFEAFRMPWIDSYTYAELTKESERKDEEMIRDPHRVTPDLLTGRFDTYLRESGVLESDAFQKVKKAFEERVNAKMNSLESLDETESS